MFTRLVLSYVAAKLGRRTDTPYVIAPRGELEPWRVRNSRLKYWKKQLYLSLLGRRMLQRAACLHAITPCEMEGFRQAGYDGPVAIVPNGVDARKFSQLPAPSEADRLWPTLKGRRVVLFLSRLKEEKGLDQLLPAWQQVLRRSANYDDAMLVIAGPDDRGYRKVVHDMLNRYDLPRNTLLTGMVRGQEKLALMSRSDVYTLPSYSEGFSMAILENLAAGKPVLITPGCNFPEVVEAKAGISVPPEAGPLTDALCHLLELSNQERNEMGQRGRELVSRDYSWESVAEKMLTVYGCILSGQEIPTHPQRQPSVRAAA